MTPLSPFAPRKNLAELHERTFAAKIAATYARHSNDGKPRECEPDFSLERKVERARLEMGPERWNQLQAEWSSKP